MLRIHSVRTFIAFILVAAIICASIIFVGHQVIYKDNTEEECEPLYNSEVEKVDIVNLQKSDTTTVVSDVEEPEKEKPVNVSDVKTEDETNKTDSILRERIHIVRQYESWWSIAEKYYGDGSVCDIIAAENKLTINDTLNVGDKIIIPKIVGIPIDYSAIMEDEEQTIEEETEVATPPDDTAENIPALETVMKAGAFNNDAYQYGVRTSPKVDITVPDGALMKNYTEDDIDVSNFTYAGTFSTTGYTPTCAHCCGSTVGIGAAGVECIPGYTVAISNLEIPMGATIYIPGYGFYVKEDTGPNLWVVDIACPDHESCAYVTDTSGTVPVYVVN